jgi:hypothetical protein
MSTENPRADQALTAFAAVTADPLPQEALCRALLRTLCHKLHSLWDDQQQFSPKFRWLEKVDAVAEMIGDMVGLELEEVFQAFDDGECTGYGLIEQLEPLLARNRDYLAWAAQRL